MRFLVDAQLPPTLARWIATQPGCNAKHVASGLSLSASDAEIVAHARATGAVIVSKDADFLTLAPPPPLVIVATGNLPNRDLLAVFEVQWAGLISQLAAGRSIVEIR